jgi:hypothetical protein
MKDCNKAKMDPVAKEKFEKGPHGMLQVWPPTMFSSMGRNMALSFVFYLIVGACVAYLATLGISAGTPADRALAGADGPGFMGVFRFTGTAAIMAYCFAQIPHQIWFGTPLRNIMTALVDGIVYGLITGAIFAWLWPASGPAAV